MFPLPSDLQMDHPISYRSGALSFLGLQPSAILIMLSVRGQTGFPRCLNSCVSPRLISENPSRSPKVDVSIVEIYNNNIFDLLAKDNSTVMLGAKCQMATMQEGRSEVPRLTCR